MSIQIDFRTMPANVPVMCIPRVYPNISESRIRRIFDDLDMGTIDRIDMVSKQSEKGEKFNRVFIHFHKWNRTENACVARERLLNGKEIKIIYDDPWFWKVSAYREAERKPQPQSRDSRKATIQFDSDDERPARRRDDSRERPTRHHEDRPRHHEDRPRHHEDRPRHHDQRPRNDRPRHHDNRPKRRDESPARHQEDRPRHNNNRKQRDESPTKHQDKEFKEYVESLEAEENRIRQATRIGNAGEPIETFAPVIVDYGKCPIQPVKRRIIKRSPDANAANKPLKIEGDLEDGEVEEN